MKSSLSRQIAILTLCACATPAFAKDVSVSVPARSGPWLVEPNAKKMPYGVGDQGPPVTIDIDAPGQKIGVFAEGTTDTADKKNIDGPGISGDQVDDKNGAKKKRYPSFYAPKVLYPAYRHGLVVTFTDAKGVVVGRPVMVGSGILVPVPDDAAKINLGFNDVTFAANSGDLKVTVQLPD